MTDNDAQYDSYEVESDTIGPAIIYPIIASVFSAFCIISIAAFVLSSRKCCKQRKNDAESALLKQRLITEQKKMTKYKCKFPFGEPPIFSSIMQQEENEIAEEVKENYKSISTHINKPIICCPYNKTSYIYNPQPPISINKLNNDAMKTEENYPNSTNTNVNNNINNSKDKEKRVSSKTEFETDPSNKTANKHLSSHKHNGSDNDFIDSLEKQYQTNVKRNIIKTSKSNNKNATTFFTEAEIADTEDLKSLFFKKWITRVGDEKADISNEEIHQTDPNLSYDDVESVLTSISRMDSCRMQKLRDSKFYKKLLSQMEPIEAESPILSEDDIDPETLNEILLEKTGNSDISLSLTHEELMQAVLLDNENYNNNTFLQNKQEKSFKNKNNAKQNGVEDIPNISNLQDAAEQNKHSTNIMKNIDKKSESLFKVVQPVPNYDEVSESTLTDTEIFKSSRGFGEINYAEVSESIIADSEKETKTNFSYTSSDVADTASQALVYSYASRPNSLNLKRKHTDLNIDVSNSDCEGNSRRKRNVNFSKVDIKSDSSYSSSCSSKSTTWQEIYKNRKDKITTSRDKGSIFTQYENEQAPINYKTGENATDSRSLAGSSYSRKKNRYKNNNFKRSKYWNTTSYLDSIDSPTKDSTLSRFTDTCSNSHEQNKHDYKALTYRSPNKHSLKTASKHKNVFEKCKSKKSTWKPQRTSSTSGTM